MHVTITDRTGKIWSFHNAEVNLLGDTLVVRAPTRRTADAKKTMYNFILKNLICYVAEEEFKYSRDKEEDNTDGRDQ